MPYGAKVTPTKDRHGNVAYTATVLDAKGNTIGSGYGDTPAEACDNAGGK
jgi:hypothetical protein